MFICGYNSTLTKYNRLVKTLSIFTLRVCPVIMSSKNTRHSDNTRISVLRAFYWEMVVYTINAQKTRIKAITIVKRAYSTR